MKKVLIIICIIAIVLTLIDLTVYLTTGKSIIENYKTRNEIKQIVEVYEK